MKPLVILLCLLPSVAGAQKYFLIDRQFKEPFEARDTITLQDVANGIFPLYSEDLPVVIDQLQDYARHLANDGNPAGNSAALKRDHSTLFMSRSKGVYKCVLQTYNKEMQVPMMVANGNRRYVLRQMTRFLDYLRQNKAVIQDTGSVWVH